MRDPGYHPNPNDNERGYRGDGTLPAFTAPKCSNREARGYAARKEAFTTHNSTLYGRNRGNLYIVYSYGPHFPLLVFDKEADKWYKNNDTYSRTTSKHAGLFYSADAEPADTEFLQLIIASEGVVRAVARRMGDLSSFTVDAINNALAGIAEQPELETA